MKWFKHESDSHANIKLQAIIDAFGLRAYGYYWACLELVASQGENYRLKRDKRWEIHLKKMLNIEIDEQKKFLSMFSRHNLIDRESIRKGDLYIPKLEERSDEYSQKVRRKSGHNRDNVGLEQKRIEQKREERPSAHISYLRKLPKEDIEEFLTRFNTTRHAIMSKAESFWLYCESKGKRYSNYKAALLNAMKKDFEERKIQKAQPAKEPEKEITAQGREAMKSIKDIFKK